MYPPETPYIVYCAECYNSDKWNPLSYARDYDFSKPFFSQFKELMEQVPRRATYRDFDTNSEYTNWAIYLKNCYLVFGAANYEDCSYASQSLYVTDCIDVDFCKKSERCSNSLHLIQCNGVHYSSYSEGCTDSWFLYSCRNCNNCVGCVNMRNASYCIFNKQYSKEEYEKKVEELNLNLYTGIQNVKEQFRTHLLRYPKKYAWIRNAKNSTGDDLERVTNCTHCFSATEDENCHYAFFVPTGAKDCWDIDHVGQGTELSYELMSGFGNNRATFGTRIYFSHDIEYSDDCNSAANLFGCIGIRKKEYCILNKQYSKEEYRATLTKIKEHMDANPYKDEQNRVYMYGEFFPPAISPFTYSETVAQEYFPTTPKNAVAQGFRWKDIEAKEYTVTKKPEDLPDDIGEISDEILNEVIGCEHNGECDEQCTTAFKMIKSELQFYKQYSLPLPRLCPNCRHAQRFKERGALKLWYRNCMCGGRASENDAYKNTVTHFHEEAHCPNEFQTPYNPIRKEVLYCEQCYNAEIV